MRFLRPRSPRRPLGIDEASNTVTRQLSGLQPASYLAILSHDDVQAKG
jgi:hypothetical protein